MKTCLLVPHYNHVRQFRGLLPQLLETGLPLLVVDDASSGDAVEELQELLDSSHGDISLIKHTTNLGKGGAVTTGFFAAHEAGYTHALQIDADGQHDARCIDDLVALAREQPGAIVCGNPVFDESISPLRYYGRYLTHALVWLETLSTEIRDSMCGFRVYPLAQVVPLLQRKAPGSRMAFDPEILVRASWAGIPIRYVPVSVQYPEGGTSHFHYLRDNVLISWMHLRLVAGMLLRLPRLVARKFSRQPA